MMYTDTIRKIADAMDTIDAAYKTTTDVRITSHLCDAYVECARAIDQVIRSTGYLAGKLEGAASTRIEPDGK